MQPLLPRWPTCHSAKWTVLKWLKEQKHQCLSLSSSSLRLIYEGHGTGSVFHILYKFEEIPNTALVLNL